MSWLRDLVSLARSVREMRETRRRIARALELRAGEIPERHGFVIDLCAMARALLAIGRFREADALLADASTCERPVRLLAEHALARLVPLTSEPATVERAVTVAGLLEIVCEQCGRRYPGHELRVHREGSSWRVTQDGRCPAGHVLRGLRPDLTIS